MRNQKRLPHPHGPRVVAIGGGHGLAVSLRALRRVTDNLTAVVGVSDDGGSSGRLRHEFNVAPPGDLRMALAALCGDDTWGRTWSRVIQHRFGGDGELCGHSLGNLLITALWEETNDVVVGLDWVGALLGAQGRVLPVATIPLEIEADVRIADKIEPAIGQVAVATAKGEVEDLRLHPHDPPACPEAVEAITDADVVVLGPGSWYTSVIAPLLVPGLRDALVNCRGRVVVVVNLIPQTGETSGFTAARHLEVLAKQVPKLEVDTVIADPRSILNQQQWDQICTDWRAKPVVRRVAADQGVHAGVHDPDLLAAAFAEVVGRS